ncbi:MAG: hypothetical protein COB08_006950 [Rhodobacteraceae bacterium]|nr:hypothetical protein [Paracoccaceae bacterium]
MSMKPQNTKRIVHVRPVQKDDYVVWDEVLSQLGRRVRQTRETWIVQTRVDGKTKRRTLGACGEIRVEAALAQAYLDELTPVAGKVVIRLCRRSQRGFYRTVEASGNRQPFGDIAVICFLTLTGARLGEVGGLTWLMIDKNRAALPDPKCGLRAIWMGRGP